MGPSVIWKLSELDLDHPHICSETYVQAFLLIIETQFQVVYFENKYCKENSNGLILAINSSKSYLSRYVCIYVYRKERSACNLTGKLFILQSFKYLTNFFKMEKFGGCAVMKKNSDRPW